MNLLLPLHRLEETLGPGWLHPLAIIPLANSTILGQVLYSALHAGVASVSLPTRAGEGEAAAWLATAKPELRLDYLVVQQTRDPLAAARMTRSRWEEGETLLVTGDAITDCDLTHLTDEPADIVCVVARPEAHDDHVVQLVAGRLQSSADRDDGWIGTGTIWFRHGRLLADALDSYQQAAAGQSFLAHLLATGHAVGARQARLHLPLFARDESTVRPETLLAANGRLLSFGRSDSDAIERSYSEEFTVVPPVFIDETATVESSVIGPQTTIAAGATVRNSVISHSIIGPGSVIENMAIENALIGFDATIIAQSWSSSVPDHTRVTPGPASEGSAHVG